MMMMIIYVEERFMTLKTIWKANGKIMGKNGKSRKKIQSVTQCQTSDGGKKIYMYVFFFLLLLLLLLLIDWNVCVCVCVCVLKVICLTPLNDDFLPFSLTLRAFAMQEICLWWLSGGRDGGDGGKGKRKRKRKRKKKNRRKRIERGKTHTKKTSYLHVKLIKKEMKR